MMVIAHRLETVLMADRIFKLDGSKLEEVERSAFLTWEGQSEVSAATQLTG